MKKSVEKFSVFDGINLLIMLLLIFITLYPFTMIISSSLSDPLLVMQNKVKFFPKKITFANYKHVFSNYDVLIAYWNTIKYTISGTFINILLTFMMAYPLSRKRFTGRKSFMKLITITLMFSGGMIPSFLVVKELGMYNTIWAVILTGAISPWNLIISKTFLESIPDSFEESAIIDGCNDIQVLKDIFIPLSLPIIATMTLFYSVAHWNSFFTSLIYLNDKKKYPLQVFLRNILIESDMSKYAQRADDEIIVQQSIKYTVIVITSFPIVCLYPFLQKYFIKGVMIGGIKG